MNLKQTLRSLGYTPLGLYSYPFQHRESFFYGEIHMSVTEDRQLYRIHGAHQGIAIESIASMQIDALRHAIQEVAERIYELSQQQPNRYPVVLPVLNGGFEFDEEEKPNE